MIVEHYLAAANRPCFAHLSRAARWALAELAALAHATHGVIPLPSEADVSSVENALHGVLSVAQDAAALFVAAGSQPVVCSLVVTAARKFIVIECWGQLQAESSRGRPVRDTSREAAMHRERQRRYEAKKRARQPARDNDNPPESSVRQRSSEDCDAKRTKPCEPTKYTGNFAKQPASEFTVSHEASSLRNSNLDSSTLRQNTKSSNDRVLCK